MVRTGKIRFEYKLQDIRKKIASFLVPETTITELPNFSHISLDKPRKKRYKIIEEKGY